MVELNSSASSTCQPTGLRGGRSMAPSGIGSVWPAIVGTPWPAWQRRRSGRWSLEEAPVKRAWQCVRDNQSRWTNMKSICLGSLRLSKKQVARPHCPRE
eukprot:5220546-Pyramimonas_sp.AAC.1